MYIGIEYETTQHIRPSKLGQTHSYYRRKSVVTFRCDNCNDVFKRDKGKIDPKRLNNNYFHVCSNCDAKRFAQKKGVEQKKVWDMPASSMQDVSKL